MKDKKTWLKYKEPRILKPDEEKLEIFVREEPFPDHGVPKGASKSPKRRRRETLSRAPGSAMEEQHLLPRSGNNVPRRKKMRYFLFEMHTNCGGFHVLLSLHRHQTPRRTLGTFSF